MTKISNKNDQGFIRIGSNAGTRQYMALEIVRIDAERNSMAKAKLDKDIVLEYDIAFINDIWSLRICLYIMLNKRYLFNPPSNKIMMKMQKKI